MTGISKHFYIAIVGPTASGKSELALSLAKTCRGAIINCDSIQMYKGFDIGSAKPNWRDPTVPHYFFDILEANQSYDAAQYGDEVRPVIGKLNDEGMTPIVVGGSGFYLRTLMGDGFDDLPSDVAVKNRLNELSSDTLFDRLQRLDPARSQQIHPNDRYRLIRALEVIELSGMPMSSQMSSARVVSFPPAFLILLDPPRSVLHQRIARRSQTIVKGGLLSEVAHLVASGCERDSIPMQSIGYRQALAYLDGGTSESELVEGITIATRQYAKRQATWFRKVKADLVMSGEDPWNDHQEMIIKSIGLLRDEAEKTPGLG
jgi:tRNA dimethylallyltransferase